MSSTIIKALWPGEKQEDYRELRNSWGSLPVVWPALAKKYLGWHGIEWLHPEENHAKVCALFEDNRVPRHQKAVLAMTLDRSYVSREHYKRAAEDIRRTMNDLLNNGATFYGGVNHWPEIANLFESEPEFPAVGFRCTTVSEDPFWGEWDDEIEDYKPFDWNTAWEIYDELDRKEQAA